MQFYSAITGSNAAMQVNWLVVCRFMVLAACLLLSAPSMAAGVLVLMSDKSAPYQEVADSFRMHLQRERPSVNVAVENSLARAADDLSADTRLLVSVGMKATRAALALDTRIPVLAVLVPREGFDALVYPDKGESRQISAIYLDQPYSRQLALIRRVFPARERIGVLLREQDRQKLDALSAAARLQKVQLVSELIPDGGKIVPSLERLLAASDLLLVLPDALLYNKNDIQGVLLTSYHYRDPVVGYSLALERAGAIMALYSKPAQIGYQAAEAAMRSLHTGTLAAPQYPKYFTVSVNQQVARSLNISVPDESDLQEALQHRDQEQ